MLAFPHAKINLGLQIKSKRKDGFHEVETCMHPIPLRDILEIVPSNKDSFTCTGIEIGQENDNLCIRARDLLRERKEIPPVSIHLHKTIPHGAGLGGGSSDAVFTLKLLNDIFQPDLSPDDFYEISCQLGSDCAFFMEDKPKIASGRGEILEHTEIDLNGKYLVLVHPGFSISTAEAYCLTAPAEPEFKIKDCLSSEKEEWNKCLKNDFQEVLEQKYPELADIRQILINKGAFYASISGSGSAYFGLFDTMVRDPKSWFGKDYFVFADKL